MTAALIPALITLTIIFAGLAIYLVAFWPVLNDRRRPAQPKHTPKHAATERTHAGGRYLAAQPRRNSPPLTEQAIITERAGRPWDTAAQPVLRQYDEHLCAAPGEHGKTGPYYCTLPAHHCPLNDDAETLRLGGWGTMPAERIIAAELPFPYDPAYDNCAGSPGCGDERVFFKWFGEQIACPRCYVNVFGGEPDARLVRKLPADVIAAELPQVIA